MLRSASKGCNLTKFTAPLYGTKIVCEKKQKSVIRAQDLSDLNSCVYVHVLSAVNFSGLTASPGRHEYMIM